MADAVPSELSRLLVAADPEARDTAWRVFLENYSRLLLAAARTVAPHEDAMMDAYAYIIEALQADDFRRLRAYRAEHRSKFTTWLMVVARRLCFDQRRLRFGRGPPREATGAHRAFRHRLAGMLESDADPDQLPSPSERDAGEALVAAERADAVAAAVRTLEARDQLLLAMRFEQELSVRDIAPLMGFPTSFHVYRRLTVVFAQLRRALRARGVDSAQG